MSLGLFVRKLSGISRLTISNLSTHAARHYYNSVSLLFRQASQTCLLSKVLLNKSFWFCKNRSQQNCILLPWIEDIRTAILNIIRCYISTTSESMLRNRLVNSNARIMSYSGNTVHLWQFLEQ